MIDEQGGSPSVSAALEVNSNSRGLLIPRMTFAQRNLISNPAEGLMIYQTDSILGLYYYEGSEWKVIGKTEIFNNRVASEIAVVRDVKASGVNGGSFPAGSWITRDLNDLRGDSSFITIDGVNTFTLDSGLYEVSAVAPARAVDEHQIRLFNVTDAVSIAVGNSIRSEVADPPSELFTTFKINSPKTFSIQHRCTGGSGGSNAMGNAVTWGENVYTQVRIQRL